MTCSKILNDSIFLCYRILKLKFMIINEKGQGLLGDITWWQTIWVLMSPSDITVWDRVAKKFVKLCFCVFVNTNCDEITNSQFVFLGPHNFTTQNNLFSENAQFVFLWKLWLGHISLPKSIKIQVFGSVIKYFFLF